MPNYRTKPGTRLDRLGTVQDLCKDEVRFSDGHYYCILHVCHLRTFSSFWKHTRRKRTPHRIIWICDEHGPESLDGTELLFDELFHWNIQWSA